MPTTAMMIEALIEHRAKDPAHGSAPPEYFWQWVERFRAGLVNQAFGILGNQADAEDVAQESLCESFEGLAQLKDPRQLGGWMRQINRRNALDLLRVRKGERDKAARARQGAGARDLVTGGYSGVDLREFVARAIDALPEDLREIVVLRYWEHLSYQDIATRLAEPVGTVKSQLFRADALLEKSLRKYVETPAGATPPAAREPESGA